ncbi:hypothetical protein ACFSUS_06825 [Spirosoma soli]|uniref:DUF4332 domain-containing protein n=1 Tax=Spirosoma soli TaxID=1770529 RepID=A0ABW5M224_9BACT
MFGLDPFSRPVAIGEIVLLLSLAAFVGWLLGRLVLAGRIRSLRASIANKEAELTECRRSKTIGIVNETGGADTSRPEPVTELTSAYVTADPLQPALAHDDTPQLITEELSEKQSVPVEIPPMAAPIPEAPTVFMPSTIAGGTSVGNSEAAVLSRIAARVGELNFDRIGRATAAEADDLKDIIGIGPFLERKLHSLGIFTYRQIANFTKEDVNKVNEIIEFFPGRIERDNWVEQSKAFHERKYGARN